MVRSHARGTAAGRRPPAAASAAGFGEVGQIGAGVGSSPCGGGRRRGRPDDAAAAAETGGEGQRPRWSRLLVALIGRYDVDELAPLPDQAGGGRLGKQQGGHGSAIGSTAVLAVGGGLGEAGAGGAPAVGSTRIGAADVAAAAPGGGGDPMASS